MFGHQDDQRHQDVTTTPVVNDGLSSANDGGTTTMNDNFNPALPSTDVHPSSQPEPAAAPVAQAVTTGDDLLSIKQQALSALSPLVGHLDQSPEEKFRTTMMLIQASDNQQMIGAAYEAAQAIPDEKVKAQALLDIVNEINYFTQQHAGSNAAA